MGIDRNACIYYLVSMMFELGLRDCGKQEQLYARMLSFDKIREFLGSCASSQTLKVYREKMKERQDKHETQLMFLELIVLFRLAQG